MCLYMVGHDIYVTLQPCKMCLEAIISARIKRLYYGAPDTSIPASGVYGITNDRTQKSLALEIYPSIGEDESIKLIKKFFKERR